LFRIPKRHRSWLIIAGLFLLPLVVYRASASGPARAIDKLVLTATSPLERLLAYATDFVAERWYLYVDVVGARRQSIELMQRANAGERLAAETEALEAENTRLRRLLELKERNPELRTLAATVVAGGSSPLSRVVRIDRGLVDGIARGAPVISDRGLVGRVQRVGYNSAEVVLIADEKVSLEVVIARSRARGRLRGAGLAASYTLEIERLLRTDDVHVGDRVLTSGLAGVYPAGVPVGVVTRVEKQPGEQQQLVEVEPAVDFARLETVLIVLDEIAPPEPLVTPYEALPEILRPALTATTTARAPE